MIMITAALYCEALPFIQFYKLKKDTAFTRFQVFRGEGVNLIITNPGAIPAAVAVSAFCSIFPPKNKDFFLNIGVCGTANEEITTGSLFLLNKIIEKETLRSFYPDLLLVHPFSENYTVTCSTMVNREVYESMGSTGFQNCLFDMEASALYQAASYFYQPHRMVFFKVVSDHLGQALPSPDRITEFIDRKRSQITDWLPVVEKGIEEPCLTFTPEEEAFYHDLTEQLKLSAAMENQLLQLLRYEKIKEGSFLPLGNEFLKTVTLPCKTKMEGKNYFEQLKQRII